MNGMAPYRWLWHYGFYDGPLSGLAVAEDGTHVWFSVRPETQHWRYRTYEYFPLTDAELESAVNQHERFRRLVGSHTDYEYGPDGRRTRPKYEGVKDSVQEFYDGPRVVLDFTDRPAVYSETMSPHNRRPRSRRYWERERAR